MATYGKYQVYYEKIKTEVEKIREENGYLNLSKAVIASGTNFLFELFAIIIHLLQIYIF